MSASSVISAMLARSPRPSAISRTAASIMACRVRALRRSSRDARGASPSGTASAITAPPAVPSRPRFPSLLIVQAKTDSSYITEASDKRALTLLDEEGKGNTAIRAGRLREGGDVHRSGVGWRRTSCLVDDVLDHADAAQRHGEDVMEMDTGPGRCLERVVRDHRIIDVEEAVAAQPVGRMGRDVRSLLVGGVSVG